MFNHAHLITPVIGVWLLRRKCSFNIVKGPEARLEEKGQTTPTTTPSSASRTPRSVDWPLEVHRKPTSKTTQFSQRQMHTTPS